MCHNGEINTVRGNRNWMASREEFFESEVWGDDVEFLKNLMLDGESDSSSLDHALELLVLSGRRIEHAMCMLVPPAFRHDQEISEEVRAFYNYIRSFSEPWDGPAGLCFTDGRKLCAGLDRNGLRPSRYTLTEDGLLYIGSESGAVVLPDSKIIRRGRLGPGQMLSADTVTGEVLHDKEIKEQLAAQKPYAKWVDDNRVELKSFSPSQAIVPTEDFDPVTLSRQQVTHGVTAEDLDVMTLGAGLGPEQNLLTETPEHARILQLCSAILFEQELETIIQRKEHGFSSKVIDTTWPASEGEAGLKKALDRICAEAEEAVNNKVEILILSDRATSADKVPIPSLLATGSVHHHLNRCRKRLRTSLVVDTGEARDTHQIACLFGFGATAVCPYLGYNYAFTGVHSRIGGVGFSEIAEESLVRHRAAFQTESEDGKPLNLGDPGYNRYRKSGEAHALTTDVIKNFHTFVRDGKKEDYDDYVKVTLENDPITIKDILDFKVPASGVSLDDVEPAEEIVKRWARFLPKLTRLSPSP